MSDLMRRSVRSLSEMVLGRLNTLVKQFVYRSSLNHGFSEQKAKDSSVALRILYLKRELTLFSRMVSAAARSLLLAHIG